MMQQCQEENFSDLSKAFGVDIHRVKESSPLIKSMGSMSMTGLNEIGQLVEAAAI
jgi:hypothetical protein